MWRSRTPETGFGPDDYDQPTQPLERVIAPAPSRFAAQADYYPPRNWSVPAPETPVPPASLQTQTYPILPSTSTSNVNGQALRLRPRQRSRIPGLLGVVSVLVQLILLGRVICLLLSVSATTPWYGLLVTTSDLLIWPARQLASAINTSVLAGTQLLVYLEFLLSILIYGLLARLLVRLLNRWLNGH